ncbi:MAG: hypothetical protein GC178_17320 [Flavobacteriales bacterium]|nr:hypothetical protein [Flavobacteriales bacterium]
MAQILANNRKIDRIITILRPFAVALFIGVAMLPSHSFGQNPISLDYNEVMLREDFSAQNENWPYLTTMENLYVPDKDEYFMHRRNKTNPYAIITDWKNNLSRFNILTTLKLGPTEDANQTIGVIFLVQPDGKGAIVFEFNKFKQYRIKQLVGAYYKFLSGDNESQGWVKSSALAGKNEYNEIDIRVDLPQVDIYLNKKFIQSFDLPDYKPGNMGFLIGPDTKAKADYFYVYSTAEEKVEAALEAKEVEENQSATEQLAKMRYELEQEKRNLRECQMERQKAVSVLEDEMGTLRQQNEKLATQNRQLQEFKNQVLVEVDEDVFLTLAENLKTEIIKNQKLEAQVQVYKDSLKLTHIKYNKLKLALLDKAIKKAEKEKEVRDQQEAAETKKEIEEELRDKKLKAEQEEWEAENAEVEAKIDSALISNLSMEPEKKDSTPISPKEVSEERIEARPLPVKVRTARKKQE